MNNPNYQYPELNMHTINQTIHDTYQQLYPTDKYTPWTQIDDSTLDHINQHFDEFIRLIKATYNVKATRQIVQPNNQFIKPLYVDWCLNLTEFTINDVTNWHNYPNMPFHNTNIGWLIGTFNLQKNRIKHVIKHTETELINLSINFDPNNINELQKIYQRVLHNRWHINIETANMYPCTIAIKQLIDTQLNPIYQNWCNLQHHEPIANPDYQISRAFNDIQYTDIKTFNDTVLTALISYFGNLQSLIEYLYDLIDIFKYPNLSYQLI